MGLDNVSTYSVNLRNCDEDLIIKTCDISEEAQVSDNHFSLTSLYTLLENRELTKEKPNWSKITSLDLSSCLLSELPKCINILHLTNLNLSHNEFKQVPSCLYNGLENLEILDLSYNKLSQFDIEPDCVLSLKVLKINNNCFENIPKWFLTFRCTNLEEINYSENHAKHYSFLKNSYNQNFMKLRKLEFQNSCLLDIDIPWLKCFKTLQYLDISNKSLVRDIKYINKFKELDTLFVKPQWKEIQVLKVNFLDISFFPEGIFWLANLKELYINNNMLSWFPDGIEYLINLEKLDVSNNQLIFLPKQISQLKSLKYLFVSGNQLEEIPMMPENLEVIDLFNNYLLSFENENLEYVEMLDLELNFVNLEDSFRSCYGEYCSKRDRFRNIYNCSDRASGFQIKNDYSDSSDLEKTDSDWEPPDFEYDNSCENVHHEFSVSPEEDWDRDTVKAPVYKHPDISLSDQEYDGEKEKCSRQNLIKRPPIYIDEEDLWFIDAD